MLEVRLEGKGGSTTVRLINSGFGEDPALDDDYQGTDSGWQVALATLKYWLEHHRQDSRVHRFDMRPAPVPFDHARVLPFFTTAAGLDRWLGRGTAIDGAEVQEG